MKKLQLLALGFMVFLISISCVAVTGKPDEKETYVIKATQSPSLPKPKPGGVITKVTLARGITADYTPVDVSTDFGPDDTIHAIVTVKKAPPDTKFTVKWLTTDVGDTEKANFEIDTTETVQTGTGNLDFTLAPSTRFMAGKYRVEVYVNDNLDQLEEFTIAETK
jgi:hypothetical protein